MESALSAQVPGEKAQEELTSAGGLPRPRVSDVAPPSTSSEAADGHGEGSTTSLHKLAAPPEPDAPQAPAASRAPATGEQESGGDSCEAWRPSGTGEMPCSGEHEAPEAPEAPEAEPHTQGQVDVAICNLYEGSLANVSLPGALGDLDNSMWYWDATATPDDFELRERLEAWNLFHSREGCQSTTAAAESVKTFDGDRVSLAEAAEETLSVSHSQPFTGEVSQAGTAEETLSVSHSQPFTREEESYLALHLRLTQAALRTAEADGERLSTQVQRLEQQAASALPLDELQRQYWHYFDQRRRAAEEQIMEQRAQCEVIETFVLESFNEVNEKICRLKALIKEVRDASKEADAQHVNRMRPLKESMAALLHERAQLQRQLAEADEHVKTIKAQQVLAEQEVEMQRKVAEAELEGLRQTVAKKAREMYELEQSRRKDVKDLHVDGRRKDVKDAETVGDSETVVTSTTASKRTWKRVCGEWF